MHADRGDRGDGGRHETEDHVEVVDHQIQDHIHVRAACGEHPQAVCLDEARVANAAARGPHDRIEALRVADQKEFPRALRLPRHAHGLLETRGHRLLDQDRQAAPQAGLDDRGVRRGRYGHADRLEVARQVRD